MSADPRLEILTDALLRWGADDNYDGALVSVEEYAEIVLRRLDDVARDTHPVPSTGVAVGDTPHSGEFTLCVCGHTAHDDHPASTACAETGCPCGRFRPATCDCN